MKINIFRLFYNMLSQLRVKLLHNYVLLLCICVTLSTNTNNFVERYSHTGVTYYRQLLFDVHNYQLIVGARDYLLRVGLDSFATSRPEAHYIPADAEKQKLCERKGMKRWQCHNYITVLLPITATKQVLVCGTNAFSPECEIRQLMSLSTVIKRESGVSRSSFSPLWNTSALLTYSGDYYYAGPLDFRGIDAAITKHPSNQLPPTQTSLLATSNPIKKSILRTMQSDSKWINADANFVFNFEYENHIYFLFRESAVEYINCGKKIYSRIGRVCKNDVGGQLYYRENWTSFTKSRLNCSIPGLFPFYFDEIESVDWVDSGDVPTLYATFNTPENSIHGSAVCAYRIDAVLTAFHGLFKQQKSTDSMWQSSQADKDTFECQAFNKNQSEWHQMQRLNSQFQLMDSAVQSVNGRPYVIETNKRFQFIAVDVIQSKHHKSIEVMFVSTTDGWLMKYVRWPFATKSCLIDQFRVIANTTNDAILSMKLLRDTQSIYLGTKREIIRISVERCHQYTDKTQCELSGDPYCGWDQLKLACTTAPGGNPHSQEWLQSDSQQCQEAKLNQWSDWLSCNQLNKTIGDQCFCRMRSCAETSSSDTCINGKEVQVSNCTQHGGWTDWSQWSQCSATCGATNKYRYRKCSNPAPAFGGRQCRGPDKESIQCTNLPPCVNLTQPEPVKPINQWSDWSDWEVCSSKCGGGVQLRRRRCEYKDMYKGCVGCDVEWRICNRHECAESRQHSEWTDWLIKNITGDGVVEQRFRFICKSQTGEGQGLSVQTKIEERFIASNNVWSQCSDDACNGWQFKWNGDHYIRRECTSNQCQGWTQWTQWTQCMYGKQFRSRQCDGSDKCVGHYKEFRHCDRNNEQYVPNEENNSLDMINDKPVFRSSLSAEAESSNEQTVSLQKLVLFCILSFITGGFICGLIIYILLTKTERFGGVSHKRLSLRQFLPQKSTANAYESPHDYKSNSSVLSPLNSSIPPVREATIKRGSSIRAQLHSDQNF